MDGRKVKIQRIHKEEVTSDNEDDGEMWVVDNSNSGEGEDGTDYLSLSAEDDLMVEIRRAGRSNPYWTQEIEQVFIERIKSYPPLYDHSNENWKNTKVKDVIWEEISEDIGIPATECRRHFKHMRDKFVRHKRTGRGSRTWKAGEAMNFLVEMDLIKHRPKNQAEIDGYGPLTPDKSRSDEMNSNSPTPKAEICDEPEINFEVPSPPMLVPARCSRSMKRKCEDNGGMERLRGVIPKETILEYPSTISKASLRIKSSDSRLVADNGHLEVNGHSTTSAPNIFPSQQLLLTPIPAVAATHGKSGDPEATKVSHGPNYYFGQYIASVLDALPQTESLMTRHKLQEILFESQRKAANPPLPQIIQFQCTNCTNRFTPI